MKLILQEEPSGCGICCVAFALNKSYVQAKKLFAHPEYASLRGYYCRDLVKALKKGGLKYTYAKVRKSNKKLLQKPGTIVFIRRSVKHPQGHYVIRAKNFWMNPWKNFPMMISVKAGFQKRLPGKAQWIIYQIT